MPDGTGEDTTRGPVDPDRLRLRASSSARVTGTSASRMSCQSVTSSDPLLVIQDHDQGQRDRSFACRDSEDHDRENLTGPRAVIAAETNQAQGRALQHHLDRQKHDDQVPARQKTEHPQREQNRPHQEVVPENIQRENVARNHGSYFSENEILPGTWNLEFDSRNRRSSRGDWR